MAEWGAGRNMPFTSRACNHHGQRHVEWLARQRWCPWTGEWWGRTWLQGGEKPDEYQLDPELASLHAPSASERVHGEREVGQSPPMEPEAERQRQWGRGCEDGAAGVMGNPGDPRLIG